MRLNDLDLNLLRSFVIVAEEKSFTQAAKKLFLEQSAVSKAVKRLEGAVGAELFKRTKRHVQLTTKGLNLLPIAKGILQSGEDFLRVALDKQSEISGILKFGAENPLSFLFMPDVISSLSKEYPGLWPMMFTGVTEDIVRRVKERELEFAIVFYEGLRLKDLEYQELGSLDFKLVTSRNASATSLNTFIGSREINDTDSPHLPTFIKLKKLNKSIQVKYSANDMVAYQELVLRGLGIGLLPELIVRKDLKAKKLKAHYPNIPLNFPIFLIRHASFPLSHEANRMIEAFKRVLSQVK